MQWKSSSSFRKRAPVKEPGASSKLERGAVCSYNPSTRGGSLTTEAYMSFQKSYLSPCKKDMFCYSYRTHLARCLRHIFQGDMSGSCSSNSLPIQLASENTTNSKSSQKNAKTAPPSCKPHVIWSDEGQSKWNDITTTNTTLVELDFFFSPLWEHFGSQMGLPDPFVILTDPGSRWSR